MLLGSFALPRDAKIPLTLTLMIALVFLSFAIFVRPARHRKGKGE